MELRAGGLTMRAEAGELRDVRFHGTLVLRRALAAVRDANWGTIPGEIRGWSESSGQVDFRIVHGDVFEWHGSICERDDAVEFHFEGTVLKTFDRNRIGLCLLLDADLAGTIAEVQSGDGTVTRGVLPRGIIEAQPVSPFRDLRRLTLQLGERALSIGLEGESFEMEDQRNWTDASYKIYGTPLNLPFPVEVREGERIVQRLELKPAPPLTTCFGTVAPFLGTGKVPGVGVFDHVRIDADPLDRLRSERQALWAHQADAPLELAVLARAGLEEADVAWARELAGELRIRRVLALPLEESPLRRPDHAPILRAARDRFPGIPIFGGTDGDYLLLKRFPPPVELIDGVTFAVNPQVHASDDGSILETPAMPPRLVADALETFGKPVAVSPVSFVPRHNPYAHVWQPRREPAADPRLHRPLGSRYLAAILEGLERSGATSVTLMEATGPRGILDSPLERVWLEALAQRRRNRM